MTPRLTDEEADALRPEAERSGRSTQDLARTAVRESLARRGQRHPADEELEYAVRTCADALRRLGG